MQPFFSVILPTYNRASTLAKCAGSVISQTFKDFELLIMDDGSDDGTRNIISAIGDPRVHYEQAINSGGPATPRNRGIGAAKGKWICFIDSDDAWLPDKLAVVHRFICSNPTADVFCHNELIYDLRTGSTRVSRYGPWEPDFYRRLLIQGNCLSTSAVAISGEFLERHKLRFNQEKEYVIVEDYDMWLNVARSGGRFFFIDSALGECSIERDNISLNTARLLYNLEHLLRDHVFRAQKFEPNREKLWKKVKLQITRQDARNQLDQRRYCSFIKLIISGFIGSPAACMGLALDWIRRKSSGPGTRTQA